MSYGSGRGGRPWRRLRARILQRDAHLCQPCLRRGALIAAKEVDHRKALAHGGTDDPANLEAICIRCHKAKTARESKGDSVVGCDADGWPEA